MTRTKFEATLKAMAVTLLLIVAWLSLAPNPVPVTNIPPILTSLVHVIMHFSLAVGFLLAWRHDIKRILPFLFVIALAFEFGQIFSTNRTFDPVDLLGNILGLGVGYLFFNALRRFAYRVPA